jgi:lysophosphatidylcholine acyltransferase / lyso-PAF acetyltransferase
MPGVAVQPVVLSYPFENLDVSWTANDSPGRMLLRMVSQVYNRMTVEYLPVYHPSDEEKANPDVYAKNVQQWFAKQTSKAVCNISNYDLL